ncbi:MAG: NERD domain-containing protein [Actinomycetia bacterium]|nr:NERD domain-containing protein [Actinomycetes bacterium]
MPSTIVVVIAIGLAIPSALVAIVALTRRQYDPEATRTTSSTDDRPPGSGGRSSPVELAPVIASCLDEATRFRARNSSEVAAVAAIRAALTLAVDGDFALEVNAVLDEIEGIEVLNDVREGEAGGAAIDHLVVAPMGVVIVDSVVRQAKLTIDRGTVLFGRGRETKPDSMIDDVLREMEAVGEMMESVPVHGVVVFQDVLSLPAEVRAGTAEVKGVRLMIASSLAGYLTEPGGLDEVALVAAVLRARFRPALTEPIRELELSGLVPAPGPPPIPPHPEPVAEAAGPSTNGDGLRPERKVGP